MAHCRGNFQLVVRICARGRITCDSAARVVRRIFHGTGQHRRSTQGAGYRGRVAGHLYWSTALAEILRERSAGQTRLLVLVGHSQGANNVINIARALESHGVTVDLLVTISPFLQNPIPANVVKAINYYQAPGWGQPVAGDRGFHGKIMNVDLAGDLTVTHITIDKNPKIQADILHEIAALAQQAGDQKPTAVPR